MNFIQKIHRCFFTGFLITAPCILFAQDIHFSQFYFSPLYLNPSQTGLMEGDYRIAANFRDQWGNWTRIGAPYLTSSVSFDTKLKADGVIKNDFLGAGIYLFSDKAGDGNFKTTNISISGAYHKILNEQNASLISIAPQIGIAQKSIDYSALFWDNQITSTGVDNQIPSGESLNGFSSRYFDIGLGGSFSSKPTNKIHYQTGIAAYHLTKPKESFLGGNNRINRRLAAHAGAKISTEGEFDIIPSLLYMKQGSLNQLNIGSAIRFNSLISGSGIQFGLWYRNTQNSDALILMTGIEYNNFTIGMSYDANVSGLSAISKGRGAYEIAIIYNGKVRKRKYLADVPCFRF